MIGPTRMEELGVTDVWGLMMRHKQCFRLTNEWKPIKKYGSTQQEIFQNKNVTFHESLSFDSGHYYIVVAEKLNHMSTK